MVHETVDFFRAAFPAARQDFPSGCKVRLSLDRDLYDFDDMIRTVERHGGGGDLHARDAATAAINLLPCIRAAGLPEMQYHGLRHGAATLMTAQGVTARDAMETLGHSQISTTMEIYTHVAPEVQKDVAVRMAKALWGQS
jgi:integrase